jgi:hypothetical protein
MLWTADKARKVKRLTANSVYVVGAIIAADMAFDLVFGQSFLYAPAHLDPTSIFLFKFGRAVLAATAVAFVAVFDDRWN